MLTRPSEFGDVSRPLEESGTFQTMTLQSPSTTERLTRMYLNKLLVDTGKDGVIGRGISVFLYDALKTRVGEGIIAVK